MRTVGSGCACATTKADRTQRCLSQIRLSVLFWKLKSYIGVSGNYLGVPNSCRIILILRSSQNECVSARLPNGAVGESDSYLSKAESHSNVNRQKKAKCLRNRFANHGGQLIIFFETDEIVWLNYIKNESKKALITNNSIEWINHRFLLSSSSASFKRTCSSFIVD